MNTLCRRESAAKNRFMRHLQMTFSGVFLLLIVRLLESGYRKSDTQVRKVDDGSAFEGNGEENKRQTDTHAIYADLSRGYEIWAMLRWN